MKQNSKIPAGTKALIFSKHYYGVLSKHLEGMEAERYFSILYFLYNNDGCAQQHICNNLSIDKTAMVKVMEYLVKCGYIERRVNPEDRRAQIIQLTKRGKQRTTEIVACFDQLDEALFADISMAERRLFLKTLKTLTEKLVTMPANDLFFNYSKTGKERPSRKKSI